MALDFCDAAGARAETTPVVSELRPRQVTFSEPLAPPVVAPQTLPQWAPQRAPIPTAPPAFLAPPPEVQPSPSESGDVATNKGGGTLKAIAIVVGVLLLAAAGWFVRRRLVEPFFARRRRASQPTESDEEAEQLPIAPRTTSKWRQQTARPTASRKVTFVVPPEEVFVPEKPPQRTQRPANGRKPQLMQQAQPSPDKKREALLAAQRAVAAKNAEKARQLSREEEASDEEEEGFFPAEEPVDPNFTEI